MTKTKTQRITITVDPKDFTQSQWEEMYNVSEQCSARRIVKEERYHCAKPHKLTIPQIYKLVTELRTYAKSIKAGQLGSEDYRGQDKEWITDLLSAANKLEGYSLGVDSIHAKVELDPTLKALLRAIGELGTNDVYTDSEEYENRAVAMHNLCQVAARAANGEEIDFGELSKLIDAGKDTEN